MKKILSLVVVMLAFVVMTSAQTQTNPVKVTTAGVKSYTHAATLVKDATTTQYYWVDNFAKALRLQIDLDTVSAGYLKITTSIYGSLDNTNYTIIGSAIPTAGATAATSNTLAATVHYNYVKVVTTAIDSTQFGLFRYKLLFDK